MKKIYKFGYITGWFVLLLILFFIFSMFISITKLRLIDIIFCVIVIILGLKYYIKYTLFYYSFYVKDEVLFIYQKHKICYQISLSNIKIEQGAFKHERAGHKKFRTYEVEMSIAYCICTEISKTGDTLLMTTL